MLRERKRLLLGMRALHGAKGKRLTYGWMIEG